MSAGCLKSVGCLKSALVENPNIASAAGLQSTNPLSSSSQHASAESSNNTRYLFFALVEFLGRKPPLLVLENPSSAIGNKFQSIRRAW